MLDRALRDRFVVGVNDTELRKKLLTEDLNITERIQRAQPHATAFSTAREMSAASTPSTSNSSAHFLLGKEEKRHGKVKK